MIRRLLVLAALVWALGLGAFALLPPRAAGAEETDGVVVLTGGEGRIARAIAVLRHGWSDKLLVSGVDPEVKPGEFAAQYHIDRATMRCCVTLGYHSTDTRSNALEAARWIATHHLQSVRLVTTDWHMRRAAFDLADAAPPPVTIIEDAVPSKPAPHTVLTEYNKMLIRRVAVWLRL